MEPERLGELRARTVREALELVAQRGENGLTMRGLAKRVGISTTAMYQLYEGKADIVREVRLQGLREMDDALAPAFELDDPAARLRDMSRRYVHFARQRPWLYRLLFTSAPMDMSHLEADELGKTRASLERLQRALAEGVSRGQFRGDLDLPMTVLRIWARNHGLILLILTGKLAQPGPQLAAQDEESFIERYVDHTVRALLRQESPHVDA
jgi:AcrR family transcriptional regulator